MRRILGLICLLVLYGFQLGATERPTVGLKLVASSQVPEEIILSPIALTVDGAGNVFVLDYKQCCVHKFSPELKYLNSFGRKGEGPGEFTQPGTISIDENENIYVHDVPARFLKFDKQGRFIDLTNIAVEFGLIMEVMIVQNQVAVGKSQTAKGNREGVIFRINPLAKIASLALDKADLTKKITSENRAVTFYLYGEGIGDKTKVKGCFGKVVMMNALTYHFWVCNASGKKVVEVLRPEIKPLEYTAPEKKKMAEMMKKRIESVPQFKSAIDEVQYKNVLEKIELSENYIYVFPVRSDTSRDTPIPIDIFDWNGKLVKEVQLPEPKFSRSVFWKNFLFIPVRDEEDDVVIRKYEMKW